MELTKPQELELLGYLQESSDTAKGRRGWDNASATTQQFNVGLDIGRHGELFERIKSYLGDRLQLEFVPSVNSVGKNKFFGKFIMAPETIAELMPEADYIPYQLMFDKDDAQRVREFVKKQQAELMPGGHTRDALGGGGGKGLQR